MINTVTLLNELTIKKLLFEKPVRCIIINVGIANTFKVSAGCGLKFLFRRKCQNGILTSVCVCVFRKSRTC